jgi:aryl-alcohol dehydrogenase-like predicted oxidoreductase
MHEEPIQRVLVGTAQLAAPYGLYAEQVDLTESRRRLSVYRKLGFRAFDTAPAYPSAESLLGSGISSTDTIVTKTNAFDPGANTETVTRAISEGLSGSLERLDRERVDGLLLHTPDALTPAVASAMRAERDAGRTGAIGVSVYTTEHIDSALDLLDPDIVQLPFSIADQRLSRSGHIDRLMERGVEVHARSVFLQGTLLANPGTLPAYLDPLRPLIATLREEAEEDAVNIVALCVGFVLSSIPGGRLVIGLQGESHADILRRALKRARPPLKAASHAVQDPNVVNPALWPR